jgi:hypothetical protein
VFGKRPKSSAASWISQLIEIHVRCIAGCYFFSRLTRSRNQPAFFAFYQSVPLRLLSNVFTKFATPRQLDLEPILEETQSSL